MTDIENSDQDQQPGIEPGNLKFLRVLVTALTGIMILGVLVIIALLVIRLSDQGPVFPEEISLPNGTTATAITKGTDWYAVVTDQNQILIFDQFTGALRQTVTLTQTETPPVKTPNN